MIPADFGGTTIEFRGYLKHENVTESIALWGRVDGSGGALGFSTTQGLQVRGTGDWQDITPPVQTQDTQVEFVVPTGRLPNSYYRVVK